MTDEPRYEPIDDYAYDDGAEPAARPTAAPKPYKPPPPVARPVVAPFISDDEVLPDPLPPADQPAEPDQPARLRIALPYPPAVTRQISALWTAAGLDRAPPTDWPLLAECESDLALVQAAVGGLEKSLLPITVTLRCVFAAVAGSQGYVAGWEIDGGDAVCALREGLLGALQIGSAPPFGRVLIIAQDIPPASFMALIAAMQRTFEPLTWAVDAIRVDVAPAPSTTAR